MIHWDMIAQFAAAGGMTAIAWVLLWHQLRNGENITKALQAVSVTIVTMQQLEIVRTYTLDLPPDAEPNEKCRRCEQGLENVKQLYEQQLHELRRIYGEVK